MVTVFLRGGLGNQMFQYALGLHVAKKYNAELALDTVFLNDHTPRREFTHRSYGLDVFMLEPRFTTLSIISTKSPIPAMWLGIDLACITFRDIIGNQKFIKEKRDFEFDPSVVNAGGNILLWGRFQHRKYFAGSEDEVRKAFTFKNPLPPSAAHIAEIMGRENSVSLHVRRGDYVAYESVRKTVGDTNKQYYEKAVELIGGRVKQPHFFIFSDDIAWCRENIKLSFPTTYVENPDTGPQGVFDMHLMSLAKHNIIANSTFSWWGAWLNKNPDKIVVAPRQWGGVNYSLDADFFSEGWVVV